MDDTQPLTSQDLSLLKHQPCIVPNRWQGECDCVVGPFSSRKVAEYFAGTVVDFGQFEAFTKRVFAKRDAFYVEIQAVS